MMDALEDWGGGGEGIETLTTVERLSLSAGGSRFSMIYMYMYMYVCTCMYYITQVTYGVCVCVCVFRMLAAEHEGVRPDMVLLGKALSGGTFPVIAHLLIMIVTQRRLHTFTNYASTPSKCTTPTQPTSTR